MRIMILFGQITLNIDLYISHTHTISLMRTNRLLVSPEGTEPTSELILPIITEIRGPMAIISE